MSDDPLTIQGQKILERIFQRDKNQGAISLETIGPQGTGKSSLDHHIVQCTLKKYPDELIFYRDSIESPVQFNRVENWQIYVEDGVTLNFRDYNTNKYFDLPVIVFKDFDDLYKKAKFGYLNVVYFKHEYTWIDFLNYLRRHMHRGNGWKTVVLEEYEDIAPQYASGKWWVKNMIYNKNAKNIRKGLCTTLANTQVKSDVSFFVRNKLMMRSYLYGAKVDDNSRIDQGLIDKLNVGECIIEYGSHFGKITFDAFLPNEQIFEVEKIVVVDEKEKEEELKDKKIKELEHKVEHFEKLLEKLDLI